MSLCMCVVINLCACNKLIMYFAYVFVTTAKAPELELNKLFILCLTFTDVLAKVVPCQGRRG